MRILPLQSSDCSGMVLKVVETLSCPQDCTALTLDILYYMLRSGCVLCTAERRPVWV